MARQKIKCLWCGILFQPKVKGPLPYACSIRCKRKYDRDITYFGGHYKDAIGYKERICWICKKDNLLEKQLNVHHTFGKKEGDEPLVVLCSGCHYLAGWLARRTFLINEHKVADLITVARFIKGLPDARTVVKYELSGE